MLHILLLILKIIGIIIAAILGILVLLVCVVIFVPIRYEARAEFDGTLQGVKARVKVTWLARLFKAIAGYEGQELSWSVRIAWKTMKSGQDDKKTIDKEVGEYDEELEKEWKALEEEVEEPPKERKGHPKEDEEEPGLPERTETQLQKTEEDMEKAEAWAVQETKERDSKGTKGKEGIGRKAKGLWKKAKALYQKIKCTFLAFCDKIKLLLEKKERLAEFITDEVHRKAFFKAKDEAFKLLRRLKPKKLAADLHYGFEDPCTTGQVLAGLSMLYPFWGEHVSIIPDFEQKVLEGSLYIKGRIRIIHFVRLMWNLAWCKEVRMTYRHVKEFEL